MRAIWVLGPESSGTRLMTNILLSFGYTGSSEHAQFLDDNEPVKERVVWRRSFPHGGEWPALGNYLPKYSGYDIFVLVMSRDWHSMASSQVAAGHVKNMEEAFSNIRKAYNSIFTTTEENGLPFEIVNYEVITSNPLAILKLGGRVNGERLVDLYDGNAKYYEGELEV